MRLKEILLMGIGLLVLGCSSETSGNGVTGSVIVNDKRVLYGGSRGGLDFIIFTDAPLFTVDPTPLEEVGFSFGELRQNGKTILKYRLKGSKFALGSQSYDIANGRVFFVKLSSGEPIVSQKEIVIKKLELTNDIDQDASIITKELSRIAELDAYKNFFK